MMRRSDSLIFRIGKLQKRATLFGVLGVLVLAIGLLVGLQEQFFRSYLVGYVFWVGISFGALGFLMIHHLVGGRWGFVIQRFLEASAANIPLMALLFIPILAGLGHLYEWTHPEEVAADEILQQKVAYLNIPFFTVRAIVYFLVMGLLAHLLVGWSRRQDSGAGATLLKRMQSLSGPGLVVVGLVVTFSAVDWVMTLEPHWFSTVYGMLFLAGNGLSTMALMLVTLSWLREEEPLAGVVNRDRFHDLGNLLLAFVMLWAYLSFAQYLITWSGNLPEFIPWYINRMEGGWQFVGITLIILHFAIPFLLLLSRTIKRSSELIGGVALAILLLRLVDVFWLVVPAFHPQNLTVHWMDAAAPLALGGVWLSFFFKNLGSSSLLARNDPRFERLLEPNETVEHG